MVLVLSSERHSVTMRMVYMALFMLDPRALFKHEAITQFCCLELTGISSYWCHGDELTFEIKRFLTIFPLLKWFV